MFKLNKIDETQESMAPEPTVPSSLIANADFNSIAPAMKKVVPEIRRTVYHRIGAQDLVTVSAEFPY